MAKYTIISDIGKGILALLRDKLVPDVVDKADSIGICDPKERGNYIVGIHPYDIKEDTSGTAKDSKTLPDGSVQDAPAMIELNYVISVSSKAEIESKALDEAKIIGKVIQIFKDNPVIPARYMPNNAGAPIENVPVNMLPINMEEKVKVWTMFGESYKLSVFYVVGPVAIDSGNIHKPKKRVESIYLGTKQFRRKKEIHFATFLKEEDIDDEYTRRPDEDEDESEDDDFGDEDSGDEDSDDDFGDDEDSGDDLGDDSGDDLDEDSDDLGDDSGDDLGDDLGDDSGDDLGDDLGDDSSDDLGDDSGDDLGNDSGDNLGDDSGDNLGDDSGDDLGDDSDDLGDDSGDDLGDDSDDLGDDSGDNLGDDSDDLGDDSDDLGDDSDDLGDDA